MSDKHHCRFHPERVAAIWCEKYDYGYCEECLEACLACTDPELYCKFRTHCIIWENCRHEVRKRRAQAGGLPNDAETPH